MIPIAGIKTIEDALDAIDKIPVPAPIEKSTDADKAEIARQAEGINQLKAFIKTRIQATARAKIINLDVRFDFIGDQQQIAIRILPH
jgi:hypothetical protein